MCDQWGVTGILIWVINSHSCAFRAAYATPSRGFAGSGWDAGIHRSCSTALRGGIVVLCVRCEVCDKLAKHTSMTNTPYMPRNTEPNPTPAWSQFICILALSAKIPEIKYIYTRNSYHHETWKPWKNKKPNHASMYQLIQTVWCQLWSLILCTGRGVEAWSLIPRRAYNKQGVDQKLAR